MKGASGQAIQCANAALGLARDHRAADRRGLPVSVTAPQGFVAAGGYAGIKAAKAHDVAVVATADGRAVPAAGVFTSQPGRGRTGPGQPGPPGRHRRAGPPAVILTSGNANAATGVPGREAAERLCAAVAGDIGATAEEILICQTGLIGIPFPIDHVVPEIEPIVMARTRPAASRRREAARAIMTTDTVPKEVVVAGDGFTVGGMAKGAAMLAPNMATMLAVLHDRRRRRPRHPAGRAARGRRGRRSTRSRSTAAPPPTTPCWCWPAGSAPARRRRRPDGRAVRGLPVAGRADGGRRRGGDQGGARARPGRRRATRRRTSRPARWPTPCS